jgi:hypothetical protein
MTGEVTSPALTARYYRRVTSGRWSMSMTDYAELADASRRLGDEHGRAGITPFGEPGHMHESAGSCGYTSYVCWDQGSSRLLDALGDSGDTTDENHGLRAALVKAYCDAYDAARRQRAGTRPKGNRWDTSG